MSFLKNLQKQRETRKNSNFPKNKEIIPKVARRGLLVRKHLNKITMKVFQYLNQPSDVKNYILIKVLKSVS